MSEKPSPMTVYDGQTADGEVEDHGPRKILASASPWGPSATGGPLSGQSRPPHAGPQGKPRAAGRIEVHEPLDGRHSMKHSAIVQSL